MLRRRALLSSVAVVPLAGCAGQTVESVLATVLNDMVLLANALKSVLASLGTANIPGLTPSILATVGGYVGEVQSAAASLSTVPTAAAAQPTLQKIESYLNSTVAVLAGLPLPPPISTALTLANIVLPFAEAAVGMVVAAVPSTASVASARAQLAALVATTPVPVPVVPATAVPQ